MSIRISPLASALAAAAVLGLAAAGTAQAATIYSGLLDRGTGVIRCSATNLSGNELEEVSIIIRDSAGAGISGLQGSTLQPGQSITASTTIPDEGRCEISFKGGKSKVRGVLCTAPSAGASCTATAPLS